ncbi:hypothetical protein OS122_02785 [Mycolicibacterium mucogenicum]|uniref:hypothetical protein n=1 Tax=Mycolicibacterium mucogenicum TaxID=56689 RepID=UPI00226A4338|nr:hypothetical protein [Mycolicibacterium mucogenicum]MCX8559825.1 hypothetical protein [Mycolicibacterium mucogenicum]
MNIDDLRPFHDAAIAECGGDSMADRYERGALSMAWEGLTGEAAAAATDTLSVELRGVETVGSYPIGRVSTALQNAVAYIGKYQRNPRISPQASLAPRDRERFKVVQEAQVGNTLIFRVPAIPMEPTGVDIGRYSAVAGRALRELIETLPQADNDSWSPAGILGSPLMIRRALHDISRAAADLPDGLAMRLVPESGPPTDAELSHARAADLKHELDDRSNVIGTENPIGLLDGLRGTRRVFYLIKDDGAEIAGAVDAELLQRVEQFEHQRVQIHVETTQWVKKNGRLGRKAYRLLDIGEAPEQLELE